jgi:hypothetical protein
MHKERAKKHFNIEIEIRNSLFWKERTNQNWYTPQPWSKPMLV